MPERKYTAGGEYRYGFNGQEKSDNVTVGNYTAEYWEYDSRIGRRWNLDPKPLAGISKYSTFGGNPIWFNDPRGDTTFIFNEYGKYIKTINDGLPNEIHFVRSMPFLLNVREGETWTDAMGRTVRAHSIAFIGANTVAQAKKLEEKANKDNHEIFFLGKIGPTKEIVLTELILPEEAYSSTNTIAIGKYIDGAATDKEQLSSFLIGHTHQLSLEKNNLIDSKLPTLPGKALYFNKDNGSGDYAPVLNRTVTKFGIYAKNGKYTITEKSQSAALIVSHKGITVYGTGTNVNVPINAGYTSVDNIIIPKKESYIPNKSLEK